MVDGHDPHEEAPFDRSIEGEDDSLEMSEARASYDLPADESLEDETDLDALRQSTEIGADAIESTSSPSGAEVAPRSFESDATEDADHLGDDLAGVRDDGGATTQPEWNKVVSAQRIAIELKRIEQQVRDLLGETDSKRKRRFTGTRRWRDLEDDIINWYYASRFDEKTLADLRQAIARRHYLFRRLHFLAGTRRGWNS